MLKYYLMAMEKGNYYYNQYDFENMLKYYLMAIEKDHSGAMNNLGNYYNNRNG
jgi:TPR repeat protein